MKLVKKLLVVLSIIVTLTGCGGSKNDEELIGKWCGETAARDVDGNIIGYYNVCELFNEDGTYTMYIEGSPIDSGDFSYTWSTNKSKLTTTQTCKDGSKCLLDMNGNEVSKMTSTRNYEIEGNHLKYKGEYGTDELDRVK